MDRLSANLLPMLRTHGIATPVYDRDRVSVGVVHFGPGAFHRVHQAFYFDQVLAHDNRWGICEVALQSTGVRDALNGQDGLYTLAILGQQSGFHIVGAAKEFLVARESSSAVLARLVNPDIRVVTATITEKGYCLAASGGLDFAHPEVRHDLEHPDRPRTFVAYLVAALRKRRDQGTAPFNVISCDNLTANGRRVRGAVIDFAGATQPDLIPWLENEVAFPGTMVDSITPATDDALRLRIKEQLGFEDYWPVQRESFTQWVIEDAFRGEVPDWSRVGVNVSSDVQGYEKAKLRLLNGAHSSLAYIGSLAGFETVSQAMTDPSLSNFIADLMRHEISATVAAPRDLDLSGYISSLLQRFRNPMLPHRLAQIAWDGSQKIPFRLLGTIADLLAVDRPIDKLCVPIAAWFQFIKRKAANNDKLVDPIAARLLAIGGTCNGTANDCRMFLQLTDTFPRELAKHPKLIAGIESAYGTLSDVHDAAGLARYLGRLLAPLEH
jgi:fructuronate reductase